MLHVRETGNLLDVRHPANRSQLWTQCFIDNSFGSELNYPKCVCFGAFTSKQIERTQHTNASGLVCFVHDTTTSAVVVTATQSSQGGDKNPSHAGEELLNMR